MTSPHIAHTVEDVRRLAPVPGWYWVRARSKASRLAWAAAHLLTFDLVPEPSDRLWCGMDHSDVDGWGDKDMVGFEIIGPIPEPGT